MDLPSVGPLLASDGTKRLKLAITTVKELKDANLKSLVGNTGSKTVKSSKDQGWVFFWEEKTPYIVLAGSFIYI